MSAPLDETGEAIALVLAFCARRDELQSDVLPLLDAAVVIATRVVYGPEAREPWPQ